MKDPVGIANMEELDYISVISEIGDCDNFGINHEH